MHRKWADACLVGDWRVFCRVGEHMWGIQSKALIHHSSCWEELRHGWVLEAPSKEMDYYHPHVFHPHVSTLGNKVLPARRYMAKVYDCPHLGHSHPALHTPTYTYLHMNIHTYICTSIAHLSVHSLMHGSKNACSSIYVHLHTQVHSIIPTHTCMMHTPPIRNKGNITGLNWSLLTSVCVCVQYLQCWVWA